MKFSSAASGTPLRPRAFVRPWVVLCLLAASGCASAPARPPLSVGVQVEPASPSQPAGDAALPPLPVSTVQDGASSGPRIQQLDMVEQDIRLVLRSLAQSYGLDYEIDPRVEGRVTARLNDVTLTQALDAVLIPHGFDYQIQGRVLRVVPNRMQTRIFGLDYLSMSRTGIGTTVVQRRLGTTGGGAGSISAGGGSGGDVIQTVTISDLWDEIRVALEGLIFDVGVSSGPGGGLGATSAPAVASTGSAGGSAGGAGGVGGGARGPGPYSRVQSDGRRLIINPLSGTVVVAAPPAKLDEVAAFLATIEASLHRQVLIEAKIVEVSLNREFQFGIDWSFVQRIGNLNLRVGGGSNGAQFTLNPGPSLDQEVNVVLNALERQGHVSVLSAPRVSVMNNQRAMINAGRDEVFFSVTRQPIIGPNGGTIGFNTQIEPQQIAVGVVLDVLAQISPDNTITLNVRPVVTSVVEVREVRLEDGTQASAPVIDRRESDTVVRVRGGETIIIGGLMQTTQSTQRTGIPGLRSIPGIGALFGGTRDFTEKRELVIFITPRIVAGQPLALQ